MRIALTLRDIHTCCLLTNTEKPCISESTYEAEFLTFQQLQRSSQGFGRSDHLANSLQQQYGPAEQLTETRT